MREMKDSGVEWIGEIPVDWKVCRVKFLADNNHLYPIGDGDHGMIKSSDYLDEGIPYIRVLNLTWCNGLNLDNLVFISEEMNNRVRNSELKPNDILVAKTGATIGKTAIVPMSLPLSNTTSHVGKISIASIHSAKYFYYVMSSFVVQKQIRDISAMQSTRPELGIEGLKNLIVIVPSYTDQKQISDFLDAKCAEIDALSSDIQAQIDTLEQYKRSVISEAVTKGLDPNVPMKDSGIEWVGKIPASWDVSPIRANMVEVTEKNIFGKVKQALKFTYGQIVPKTNFDADEDSYVADTILNYTIVTPGTIVLNGLNLNFDFVTKRVGLVGEAGVITSAYIAFKPIDNCKLSSEFVTYLLKTYDACKAFHNMGGGVRKILNYSELKKVYIVFPSYDEQQAIVDYLDAKCSEIDQVIAQKQEQLSTLADYKKSLIYEYVTGKKEVPAS